jgi:DNA-binding response OmpR family regulator
VLDINRFVAVVATDAAEALAQLTAHGIDLVIVDLPFAAWPLILERVDDLGWHQPVIALGTRFGLPEAAGFDSTLPREYSPAELLDHIKLLNARKRGPRKKDVASAPAVAAGGEVVNF